MIKNAVLKPFILLILWVQCGGLLKAANDTLPNVWMNEIHYTNSGDDTLQGFEIAGPAGINLACYEVFLYDGTSGNTYATDTLTGALANQEAGFGTMWFDLQQGVIQNTTNGGYALEFAPVATGCGLSGADTLVQFLSYGNQFYAANGPAQGHQSALIPAQENSSTPVGYSLQLGGTGMKYSDFGWQSPMSNTYNSPNTNQTFVTAYPIVQFVIDSETYSERGGQQMIAVMIENSNNFSTQVDINVLPGGTAQNGVNFTYSPVTMTFPANSPLDQFIYLTPIDDSVADGNKTVTFKLAYPGNNASVGANSQFVVTITNADTLYINMPEATETVQKTAGVVNVPVTLNLTSTDTTSVQVSLGLATTGVQGTDFAFDDTTITWLPGTRGTILVPITVIDNEVLETDKLVQLQLTNPTNDAIIENGDFDLTILEVHDTTATTLQFLEPDTTVALGSGWVNFVFEINNPSGSPDTFTLIADGNQSTAIPGYGYGYDYYFTNQQFSGNYFPAGITYDTLSVYIDQNALVSPTVKVVFRFVDPGSNIRVLPDSVFTMYITNTNQFEVTFAGAGYSYPNDTPLVEVPVALTTFSPFPTTADITLAPGSAVRGVDFNFTDTTVVFPAFSTDTQGVWVQIIPNSNIEPNKQINFNLSNPTNNAVPGITGYTLTIINDDSIVQGIITVDDRAGFTLFPNPVTNSLNVQSATELGEVSIADVTGNLIYDRQHLSAGQNTIDVSKFSAGIYFITAKFEGCSATKRFVKID